VEQKKGKIARRGEEMQMKMKLRRLEDSKNQQITKSSAIMIAQSEWMTNGRTYQGKNQKECEGKEIDEVEIHRTLKRQSHPGTPLSAQKRSADIEDEDWRK
jgi:hypothetical protein